MDRNAIREDILSQGYSVVRGLLTPAQVDDLRGTLGRFFRDGGRIYNLGKSQPNAAMACPDIDFLITLPQVVEAFRAATGDDRPVFTGHCDIHQDMISDWHKDTGHAHGYFAENCFIPECTVIKMGVYLQDHEDGSGLTVIPGSHLNDDPARQHADRAVPIASRAGDVVLFDIRITHRGRPGDGFERGLQKASRLATKLRKASGEPAAILSLKQGYDRVRGIPSRHSVFFTFGADNRFTHQFAERNMARQLRQSVASNLDYRGTLRSDLERQGVQVFPGTTGQTS